MADLADDETAIAQSNFAMDQGVRGQPTAIFWTHLQNNLGLWVEWKKGRGAPSAFGWFGAQSAWSTLVEEFWESAPLQVLAAWALAAGLFQGSVQRLSRRGCWMEPHRHS